MCTMCVKKCMKYTGSPSICNYVFYVLHVYHVLCVPVRIHRVHKIPVRSVVFEYDEYMKNKGSVFFMCSVSIRCFSGVEVIK